LPESGYLKKLNGIELAKDERHRERVISEPEQQNAIQPRHDCCSDNREEGTSPDEAFNLD
jgi:hypothetical protein